jgi:deoxyribodipyrimidine photolyase-related protein
MDKNAILSTAVLLFPHQLFAQHEAFCINMPIVLIEEYLFFSQFRFHKKKLVLHRATMKNWQAEKEKQGYTILYVEAAQNPQHDVRRWIQQAASAGLHTLHVIDPADDWLQRRVSKACKLAGITLVHYTSPNYLNTPAEGAAFFATKKRYHQTDFYIAERKKRNLLLEPDGSPLGGKWTFDAENRETFPQGELIPKVGLSIRSNILSEAMLYVDRFFPDGYGDTANFAYPTSRKEALKWLDKFLKERLGKFGVYEDAMVATESFLYHSVLTPALNIGLLQPAEVIEATLQYAAEYSVPLNSLEGFVRQIIGWREFIRMVYHLEGRKQRTRNYWQFTRKIPPSFWKGETGITPVDMVIKKVLRTAYNHHIERLMVLGNFFLLCEFDPNEVYRWFMEMYIDAYDWVMVPNVYGMTQFADGGLMTTKPYISSSNYLMKMGDWPKGEWQKVWDGLFWRFMHVHRDFFLQNPRLGMLVKTFDKMSAEKQEAHLRTAEDFLTRLDQGLAS